ncbi:hypothetical protein M427DRAFT_158132 [Gonapodya prolifera JEL478]|uniref:Uncharacterized protein n=1 Tax=Gonapodya prolifera (strain JEL478) TaxID=1344416 RepID=A0A139A453_GONPJ|nr:hypothetical protein M427DRAFT_158132 [Gonapodya prolifera JEL478]|eukprot:KXS11571.1 hypothetical protein M427DRAFT_158132 [Gonapodya prolifera JEL478]
MFSTRLHSRWHGPHAKYPGRQESARQSVLQLESLSRSAYPVLCLPWALPALVLRQAVWPPLSSQQWVDMLQQDPHSPFSSLWVQRGQ